MGITNIACGGSQFEITVERELIQMIRMTLEAKDPSYSGHNKHYCHYWCLGITRLSRPISIDNMNGISGTVDIVVITGMTSGKLLIYILHVVAILGMVGMFGIRCCSYSRHYCSYRYYWHH